MKYTNEQLYELILNKSKQVEGFLTIQARQCLEDRKRSLALMNIVSRTVEQGDNVVDMGTGYGLLAVAAANNCAEVTAIAKAPQLTDFVNSIAQDLDFPITAIWGDARLYIPQKPWDYVIAELVQTGLSDEPIVQVMKSALPFTHKKTKFLPSSAVSYLRLIQDEVELSGKIEYDNVLFSTNQRNGIDTLLTVPIIRTGCPNYVLVDTVLSHPDGSITGNFDTLCKTLKQPLSFESFYQVKQGDEIKIHVKYVYGESLNFELV